MKRRTNSANLVKIAQGIRPCGAFIFHIPHLGVLYPYRCTDGGEFWTDEGTFGPLLHAKFHLHQCNVSPLRGEKPPNRPLSNLNTGALRCAQCCR